MELSVEAQRVLGCLVEKALATPQQYPLSLNALTAACNQRNSRDPVVDWDEDRVRRGIDGLKEHQLVETAYARGSRVPKSAHRLDRQLDLDEAQQAVLGLLLLRGPQTVGELRNRSDRMHEFSSLELVEAVLESLAAHRFGPLVELQERAPGQKEARWRHLLGGTPVAPGADTAAGTDRGLGRYRAFHAAVEAMDMDRAVAQLHPDVVFRSPAVHAPYEGRDAAAFILHGVAQVFEDFRYVDVLDEGDRAVLRFEARVGDRSLQGIDWLAFDDEGRITELTVMVRPLSALQAVVQGMQALL